MIAIVGGGCSGLLSAANLLIHANAQDVVVVEPRETLGRGMAYSTPWYEHLLNVPAAKMSAFSAEPQHFVKWLIGKGWPATCGASFVPRRVYGEYLGEVLVEAVEYAGANASFRHIRSEVLDLELTPRGVRLILSDGAFLDADQAILALGNPPPSPLAVLAGFDRGEHCYPSAWCEGALDLASRDESILLVGSGLTAIDAAVALEAVGHTGTLHMLSRRGQLPHAHRREAMPPEIAKEDGMANPPAALNPLFRRLRQEAVRDWRSAIDSLRPVTNSLWQLLTHAEQQRFLRHLKVYWDTHRHRMAPEIGDTVDRYLHQGRLQVHAGRLLSVFRGVRGLEVSIAQRRASLLRIEVDRIINCTGIDEKYTESKRPLIRSLIAKGLASANSLGIGFHADSDGALIDRKGQVSSRLFTLGPPRSGDLIETVAVPEIRAQAAVLAHRLSQPPLLRSPREQHYFQGLKHDVDVDGKS